MSESLAKEGSDKIGNMQAMQGGDVFTVDTLICSQWDQVKTGRLVAQEKSSWRTHHMGLFAKN